MGWAGLRSRELTAPSAFTPLGSGWGGVSQAAAPGPESQPVGGWRFPLAEGPRISERAKADWGFSENQRR